MPERRVLPLLLLLEIALFALLADSFLSLQNGLEIGRATAELGLLALGMTLVMTAGGIDLSVGAVMGLTAVLLGDLHAHGVPLLLACAAALVFGALVGLCNGVLIALAQVPPLVVTLATMALARGVAEAWTGGYAVYSGFAPSFLQFGQGYWFGFLPPQLLVLAAAAAAGWLLLHRAPFGRRLVAIGFSVEGARYAGVPVRRCLLGVYAISGAAAALAGILYVSHLGQAKADAGTGYELLAVTIVALGGTPISGGRGTVPGTLLSLLTIAVLQNGLLLSGQPTELASILLGVLLVGAVLLEGRAKPRLAGARVLVPAAVLGGLAFLAWSRDGGAGSGQPLVALMPKNKSDPYFVSCRAGAEAAAGELGVELLWDGPNDTDAARQNEIVEGWITRGVDVIAVSVENAPAISTVLRKARERGIPVLTWDADAEPDARDFFINQATPEGIGHALADEAGRVLGGAGSFAIVTASLTAANQNAWIEHIRARLAERWSDLRIAVIRPSDGLRDRALTETRNILRAYPEVRLIMTIAAAAVPGSAEAVKQEGSEVKVIGLSVPSLCRSYVHAGIIDSIILWNTVDLGYLTVQAAVALHDGRLRAGSTALAAGRLGSIEVRGADVLLGAPFRFDASNIDQFDF